MAPTHSRPTSVCTEEPQEAPARKLHISRHALGLDGPTMAVTCEDGGLVYSRLADVHSGRSTTQGRYNTALTSGQNEVSKTIFFV